VYATVAKYIQDDRLRQALSFHSLLVGGNPFETSAVYTLIHYLERKWGVFFAKGGTGALVQALVRLFLDVGGQMRLATPVRRIRLERSPRRVRHVLETDRGAEAFDVVVSNADVRHTYADLLQGEPRARRAAADVERMQWSMSLFVAYFGVKTRYPDVAHHTVLFGPRYRELLDDVFHGDALPEDFSLYLHAPTVTDPSLAPPGCEAFYVLSPVPHLGAADLDWDRIAPAYAQRIYAFLERTLPGLRRNIVTERYWTPRDFQRELNAHHGSAFSVAPLLTQSAWFRPHNRDPRIPGLYLVGAGTHPGAGIPGVVQSAKATVSVVLKDLQR
jgi:phytoene desaturase